MPKKLKQDLPKFSETIQDFCKMIETAKQDYKYNFEEVNRLDNLTQDYLHQLELDGLDYSGRAKVATKLSECRQVRRESKDTVEALAPLVEYLDTEKGKEMLKLMKEVLGKTRKVEEYMKIRTYRPRILQKDEKGT